MAALSPKEIHLVVSRYIGVSGDGYLTGFSYRTHEEFYPHYCDLNVDVRGIREARGGVTTRALFIDILKDAEARDQAKIVRGVLDKFPPEGGSERERLAPELRSLVTRLESSAVVEMPTGTMSHEAVLRAIADAEHLLKTKGPVSAVDRVHTAIHGYLRHLAGTAGVVLTDDASIPVIWAELRKQHAAFSAMTNNSKQAMKMLRSGGAILEALNEIRNNASLAHVNDLVEPPEAALAINLARSLVQYAEARLT